MAFSKRPFETPGCVWFALTAINCFNRNKLRSYCHSFPPGNTHHSVKVGSAIRRRIDRSRRDSWIIGPDFSRGGIRILIQKSVSKTRSESGVSSKRRQFYHQFPPTKVGVYYFLSLRDVHGYQL